MRNIIADVSKLNTDRVDPRVFNRRMDKSIKDYMIDSYKALEALDYIQIVSQEYTSDASKIDVRLNRKHIKSKAILKDKSINKIRSIYDTAVGQLTTKLIINYNGDTRYITKKVLVPEYIDDYHLFIDGMEILPINQIVDMSTYTQNGSIMQKAALTGVNIYRTTHMKGWKTPFQNTKGHNFNVKTFILKLFTKEIVPLYYFFAKFGFQKTIKYFALDRAFDVTFEEHDPEAFHYFKIGKSKSMFLEVDKVYFDNSEFVQAFTHMIFRACDVRMTYEQLNDVEFWLKQIGMMFTTNTKKHISKAKGVLTSVERVFDNNTKELLMLDPIHKQSTYSLFRWLITNFNSIMKKDNHDLANKRVRCNEALAMYFGISMSKKTNVLLGHKKKLTIEYIEKMFNYDENELFKRLMRGKKPCELLRYNIDINNFDLYNALRTTTTGIQGLPTMCNDKSRDLYPSHLGRIDVNALSHGDSTGLTSILVPFAKIYKNGFFVEKPVEPDFYFDEIKKLHHKYETDSLYEYKQNLKRDKLIFKKEFLLKESLLQLTDKRTGRVIIGDRKPILLKHKDNGRVVIPPRNPFIKVMYLRDRDGLYRSIKTGRVVLGVSSTNYITPDRYIMPIRKDRYINEQGLIINKVTGNIIIPKRNNVRQ